MKSSNFYLKTNRVFTKARQFAWLLTIIIAILGQFYPKLGLFVPLIMIALIVTSFFKGRYWCGNFCPHGSFYDYLLLPISRNTKIPEIFRSKITISIVFVIFMFNMTRRFIVVYQSMLELPLLDRIGFVFANVYLVVMIVGGLLALIISSRTWCYICPMGTMQSLIHKLGKKLDISTKTEEKLTIKDKNLCINCAKCAKVCPMQLSPYTEFSDDNKFNDHRCIKCDTCVKNCPVNILQLTKD